nr:CMF_HP1_G0006520.mRNA.1.CDS.1 [Saccharomyces cerevisiae]
MGKAFMTTLQDTQTILLLHKKRPGIDAQSHQRALEVQNQASVAVLSWKVIPRKIIMMKKSIYCKKTAQQKNCSDYVNSTVPLSL